MKYKLIEFVGDFDDSVESDLQTGVNEAIADGWQPLGGVAVVVWPDGDSYSIQYTQAMIHNKAA